MTEPIAYLWFTDGEKRPVFEDAAGQYVFDGEEEKVRGVWFIPADECDVPVVVDGRQDGG